jgi:hypothetical protein
MKDSCLVPHGPGFHEITHTKAADFVPLKTKDSSPQCGSSA